MKKEQVIMLTIHSSGLVILYDTFPNGKQANRAFEVSHLRTDTMTSIYIYIPYCHGDVTTKHVRIPQTDPKKYVEVSK